MRVIIDAGHGGQQPCGRSTAFGARGPGGTLEKDVTLQLARRVAAHLGPIASLTRTGDVNLSLAERIALARERGAQVLVSLHANTGAVGERGAESWVHRKAGAPSRALAAAIQRGIVRLGGPDRGVRSGELALLAPERLGPNMAACVVEVDFLSDPQGERRLRDPAHLDALGRSIASGVRRYLGAHVTRQGPHAEAMVAGATVSSLPAVPTGARWANLISFRPSAALQRAVKAREPTPLTNLWHMHKLEDGLGPINLDEYTVAIACMPRFNGSENRTRAAELLEYIRLHINDVLDEGIARFSPYDEGVDGGLWRSSAPKGAVMHIDMADDGAVLCSEHMEDRWIFSTIKAGTDGYHPVSGNREFGVVSNGYGGCMIYTCGADRASGVEFWAAGDAVFSGGDDLWRSFQRGVVRLVNDNDGLAAVGSRFSERFDWDEIRAAYHHPWREGWI